MIHKQLRGYPVRAKKTHKITGIAQDRKVDDYVPIIGNAEHEYHYDRDYNGMFGYELFINNKWVIPKHRGGNIRDGHGRS